MQTGKKKIELSKETLRELTARPLTKEEGALVAGGVEPSHPCAFSASHCNPSIGLCPDTVLECFAF